MLATLLATALAMNLPTAQGSGARKPFWLPATDVDLAFIKDFSSYDYSSDGRVLEIQGVQMETSCDQLVLSWNTLDSVTSPITFEIRGSDNREKTPYYTLGTWTLDSAQGKRESTNNQSNSYGKVLTDTLILRRRFRQFDLRVSCDSGMRPKGRSILKSVHLSGSSANEGSLEATAEEFGQGMPPPSKIHFSDIASRPGTWIKDGDPILIVSTGPSLPRYQAPNTELWGKMLFVPERCQGDYPNGKVICSPTSLSMIMAYWAQKLNRPELDEGVEKVCKAVHDPSWPGTGNWPFNTAYAGSFPGMRGIVAYLRSSAHLEELISKGIPVACSVSYDLLKGKGKRGKNDGHIVVCVGFTKDGDPIFNDPGRKEVRFTYDRWDFEKAWATSNRATYLVFPESLDSALDPIWGPSSGP